MPHIRKPNEKEGAFMRGAESVSYSLIPRDTQQRLNNNVSNSDFFEVLRNLFNLSENLTTFSEQVKNLKENYFISKVCEDANIKFLNVKQDSNGNSYISFNLKDYINNFSEVKNALINKMKEVNKEVQEGIKKEYEDTEALSKEMQYSL